MEPEVAVALIGLVGALATALLANARSKKKIVMANHGLVQAESELKLQQKALDFGAFIEEWAGTHQEILSFLQNTTLDRFMIFRAWNGKLAPRWTTAVFQMRLAEQEPVSYVHFELDVDYVSRLREVSIKNVMSFCVADLPPCEIKNVYMAEGVKHAIWAHIMSEDMHGADTVSHTYCSFATHVDSPVDQNLVTRCSILAGRLKGIAMSFSQT